MKKVFLAVILMAGLALGFAQAVKLGYVNTDRILMQSNEAAEIARLFNLDKQNWSNQIRQLDEEIKQMERQFEIDKLTKNEQAKREAQTRIDTKKAEAGRLLEEYFGENGRAENRYKELIEPLTEKIHNLIVKTAEEEKYTMIFDVSMGTILYALPTIDLTEQILLELNKGTIAPGTEPTPTPGQPEEPKESPFPDIKEEPKF
ncbi:MAG: OmpH family outer membrane protein [Candidatus Cloacimonetes bacterium]|nr:OmpH family outer membrane protein [Candidatus Cloacimonadota bacterium]